MRLASPRRFFPRLFGHRRSSVEYHGLPDSESETVTLQVIVPRRFSRYCRGAKWQVLISVVLVSALFFLALSSSTQLRHGTNTGDQLLSNGILGRPELEALSTSSQTENAGGQRRLRVFMPADSPHINLCKTIMSAVALGYPLPTLLNWNGEFNRPEWHFAGSHIAKLESLLSVIEELLEAADKYGDVDENDLALMVDAYDIWFQLPPSVLIERYHQLNREADERIRQQWQVAQDSGIGFPVPPPRQSIIVTSAKDCQPDNESGSHPHYDHWPESPMPADMYGEGTDTILPLLFDPARKFKKIRPRCVNSGMVMGTIGALRQALNRCKHKIEIVARSGRQLWSDQALFGEVIGDQEMWREWMRVLGGAWNGTASEYDLSSLAPEVRRIAEAALMGETFEFGIGLDYNFTTIPATCSAEEDGYFVKLNDEQALIEESLKAGVPDGVRVNGIPLELRRREEASDADSDNPLSNVSWGDVPLYTDFYFGVTPVGIHHNAYIDNLKPWRLQNWWNLTWFYPRLRDMVSWNLWSLQDGDQDSTRLLVKLPPGDDGTEELKYLAPKTERQTKKVTVFEPASGTEPARFVPIDWDGVCQKGDVPWYDELFGDGKGPLDL